MLLHEYEEETFILQLNVVCSGWVDTKEKNEVRKWELVLTLGFILFYYE